MPVSTTQAVTGLLTPAQREFFRGERSVENPKQYRANIRHDARNRIEEIEIDLRLLGRNGEREVREEFFTRFNRQRVLEDELEELRDEVERLRSALDAAGHSPDEIAGESSSPEDT